MLGQRRERLHRDLATGLGCRRGTSAPRRRIDAPRRRLSRSTIVPRERTRYGRIREGTRSSGFDRANDVRGAPSNDPRQTSTRSPVGAPSPADGARPGADKGETKVALIRAVGPPVITAGRPIAERSRPLNRDLCLKPPARSAGDCPSAAVSHAGAPRARRTRRRGSSPRLRADPRRAQRDSGGTGTGTGRLPLSHH